MPSEQKFYVRVCRPRFEVAAIEVTCTDHDEANSLAVWKAVELDDRAWRLLPHDDDSYFPHVEECLSDNDMSANADKEDPKEAQIAEFMNLERERDQRYLLLVGDPTTGEGEVVFEPWCHSHHPQLLEADLSGDWISILEAVFNEGASANEPWRPERNSIADNDD